VQPHKSLLLLAALAFPTASALAQQHDEMMMQRQPGADCMKVAIRSPADGAAITSDKIALQVATTGFKSRCDLAGTPDQPGTGHHHVLLDKSWSTCSARIEPLSRSSAAWLRAHQPASSVPVTVGDNGKAASSSRSLVIIPRHSSSRSARNRSAASLRPRVQHGAR
jgi:hypothetical protein